MLTNAKILSKNTSNCCYFTTYLNGFSFFVFNGKEKDYESGFHYYGARYYNSELSVWLSTDPMADKYPSLTPYNYCANNPVILIDPDGRDWYECENKDSQRKEIKWTEYKSQKELEDNKIKGTYLGKAVIDFNGYRDEKFGEGAKLATATVYGTNGATDIAKYEAL